MGLVSLESTIARLVVSVAIVARILLEAYKVAKWILGGFGRWTTKETALCLFHTLRHKARNDKARSGVARIHFSLESTFCNSAVFSKVDSRG